MKEPTPQFNLRLTTSQIEECLLHMLRDPESFQYARQNLQPLDFSPLGELRYVLVWQSALNVAERNGGTLPVQGFEACIGCGVSCRLRGSHRIWQCNAGSDQKC